MQLRLQNGQQIIIGHKQEEEVEVTLQMKCSASIFDIGSTSNFGNMMMSNIQHHSSIKITEISQKA